MRRFRIRLATLGLVIVTVAMAIAIIIQNQRERALTVRTQALDGEKRALVVENANYRSAVDPMRLYRLEVTQQREINRLQADIDRLSHERARLELLEVTRQKEINKLRAEIGRLSSEGKDAGRNQPASARKL
jgi:chromosome segregation ATPase